MISPSNVVAVLRNTWTGIASGFKSLKPAPVTLWMIYLLKVLESYGYFSLGLLYVLFMTEEFGVSDLRAGTSYGIYGSLLTLWGAFLSPLVDVIGVKRSLILSLGTSMVSRTALACAPTVAWARFLLYGPISMAGALGIPVMTIGIKRCTTSANRGFAFGLFYSCMNIAAFFGGWVVEFCRQELKGGFHVATLPPESVLNSGNRILALTGAITSAVGFVVTWFLDARQLAVDAEAPTPQPLPCLSAQEAGYSAGGAESEGDSAAERQMREPEVGGGGEQGSPEGLPFQPVAWTQEEKQPSGRSTSQERSAASAEPSLSLLVCAWAPPAGDDAPAQPQRLLKEGALSSTAGTAVAARRDGPLLARRGRRQGGGGGMVDTLRQAGQEVLWMLRYRETWKFAAVAVILTNLRTIFRHMDATLPKYELRSFGCSYPVGHVYSINPFLIIVLVPIVTAATTSTEHFDAMHWGGYISALSPLWMVLFQKPFAPVLFVIQLSLGEAVWSPRWYDYSMSVAPDGREGLFSTLSSATLFFSKLPAGVLSGALLQELCPDNGECSAAAEVPADDAAAPALEVASDYVCQGQKMWLVIMLVTLTSPLLMLVTQRWLRPAPRAPQAPPSPAPAADSAADSPSATTSAAELTLLRSSARHRQYHPVLGPDAEQLPATLSGGSGADAFGPQAAVSASLLHLGM